MSSGTQLEHKLVIGPKRILTRLTSLETLTHFPSLVSPRNYEFNITPLEEYGSLLLDYGGDLFAKRAGDEGDAYVSLRFQRSFVLRPNVVDSPSW